MACAAPPVTRAQVEAALVVDGDLPAGWEAGQISQPNDDPPLIWRDLVGPAGEPGVVAVTIYDDASNARAGRFAVAAALDLGPAGASVGGLEDSARHGDAVIWRRCRAVAAVHLPGGGADAYAQRLDARLADLAC